MTTNETYFFRDPTHYDAIRTVLLPRLKGRAPRFEETAFLVGCGVDRAGSIQPGHASPPGRVERLEYR
jgi:hypothetical protein